MPAGRLEEIAECIAAARSSRSGAVLVAISGIDAAGKGTVAADLVERLRERGLRAAVVSLDDWHTAEPGRPAVDSGAEFYRAGFRFDEMFERAVEPLRRDPAVDVVLIEGIFLLKRELRDRYDFSIWVDCQVDVALERALARNQEGLPRERLTSDYMRIYISAQDVHLARDDPREFADAIFDNR